MSIRAARYNKTMRDSLPFNLGCNFDISIRFNNYVKNIRSAAHPAILNIILMIASRNINECLIFFSTRSAIESGVHAAQNIQEDT